MRSSRAGTDGRIKASYCRLWFDEDQTLPETIDLHYELVGPETTINAATIERFCDVVGNQSEKFKISRNPDLEAPMDYAIVTSWQVSLMLCSLGSFWILMGTFYLV
jgi:fatty acid synthase subunit alpha